MKVDQIAADHATPDARAYAALRLVQDEIRYVSLSVGAGGYFARPPDRGRSAQASATARTSRSFCG